eukprot:23077-Hanusia_phi.AAC.5
MSAWLVPPVVVFISWILFATEEIGLIIEEPFGRGLQPPPRPPAMHRQDLRRVFASFDFDQSGQCSGTKQEGGAEEVDVGGGSRTRRGRGRGRGRGGCRRTRQSKGREGEGARARGGAGPGPGGRNDELCTGSIDKTELLMALQKMGMDVRGDEVRALVREIDSNNNELVEFEEFMELMEMRTAKTVQDETELDRHSSLTGCLTSSSLSSSSPTPPPRPHHLHLHLHLLLLLSQST